MSKHLHQQRLSQVVHYIENNLDADIDVGLLAEIACYSEFHFHRLFCLYTGESVYAYKKRLLLERAVKQLRYSRDSITEIAFRCGYENQSSFNKAFRQQFACTPSEARQQKALINTVEPVSTTKWSIDMKPEMMTFNDTPVIYARGTGPYAEAAAEAWGKVMSFAYSNRLMSKEIRSFGISHDDPSITEPSQIRYDACLDLVDADVSNHPDIKTKTIAGGQYACFLHKGPYEQFPETYGWIFNEWLPESEFQLRDVPCFEIYLNRDPRKTKPENLRTEIYIPIA